MNLFSGNLPSRNIPDPPTKTTVMPEKPLIQITRLCKSYHEQNRRQEIFHDLDLTVQRGEFIVLLGRSGSGKSTLLNLLSAIDRPDSGVINIAGKDLAALPEQQSSLFRRRHIGFIFQAYNLIPTLTVAENLLLPLELLHPIGSKDHEKVQELLHLLGLAERHDDYPERLSGGEQQRIAIARALIHEPDIVLADEPTGNLDLETGEEVLRVLDKLVHKAGKTMIMATHSREVIGAADRIVSIRHRKLITVDGEPC